MQLRWVQRPSKPGEEPAAEQRSGGGGALNEYLNAFADGLEAFRIGQVSSDPVFDDQIVKSIEDELPYRNEYIEVLRAAAANWQPSYGSDLHSFLESVSLYNFKPEDINSWSEWDFDNL
jgi:hypothetical protein